MKKTFTLLIATILVARIFAQAPEKMSYQAVIRNSNDALVTNTAVGMQISILQGSANGTAVYAETQTPTTNTNGLVSIEIGTGAVISGDFTTIDWANDTYFIKTETDLEGGTNYTLTGTSQLLSVPYALHAKTAETVSGGITETDPVYTASEAANISATDITNLSNLSGVNTGDQDISGIATNTQAIQDTALQIRNDFPDVSGFLTAETDPVYSSSVARGITGADTANWNNKLDSYTETQTLSDVITNNNSANAQIKNVTDPTDTQDAATKAYVDALEQQIEVMQNSLINSGVLIKDYDGNIYGTVTIGTQVWLTENLKTTHYTDGTPILKLTGNANWDTLTAADAAYGWNNDDSAAYAATYGALYTWRVVSSRKLCPTGWHVPSRDEWRILYNYLGGKSVAGGKLKETGTTHWDSPNTGATNESGFTALPGGYGGIYGGIGDRGFWWSASDYDVGEASFIFIHSDYDDLSLLEAHMEQGFSVRCVRD